MTQQSILVTCPECGSRRIGHNENYATCMLVTAWGRDDADSEVEPTAFGGDPVVDLNTDHGDVESEFSCMDCFADFACADDLVVDSSVLVPELPSSTYSALCEAAMRVVTAHHAGQISDDIIKSLLDACALDADEEGTLRESRYRVAMRDADGQVVIFSGVAKTPDEARELAMAANPGGLHPDVTDGKPRWYAVTGRVPGDEDTTHVFHVLDRYEAEQAFKDYLTSGLDQESRDSLIDCHGTESFINSIVSSATEIAVL